MKNFKRYFGAAVGGSALVAGSAMAQATTVDVSSITAVITEAGTAAATIGLAVLAMHYGIKLYKWIRGAG
jgi:hypothetical protein